MIDCRGTFPDERPLEAYEHKGRGFAHGTDAMIQAKIARDEAKIAIVRTLGPPAIHLNPSERRVRRERPRF